MRLRRATATADSCTPSVRDWGTRAALITLFALLSMYLFLMVGIQHIGSANDWITADWLINYSHGFIRRGLIGEIGRQLHYAAAADPVSVILTCKVFCYATICASLLLLASRRTIGIIELVILFSPALLSFEINDPLASGRKEVVLLALFASYVAADQFLPANRTAPQRRWRFWFLLTALPLMTLVHEALFFFAPFFFVYAWVNSDNGRDELRNFAIPYAMSAVALALSWMFRGGIGVSSVMCASITSMGVPPAVCGGATAALERYDVHISTSDIQRYVVLACLIFGPLLWYGSQALDPSRMRQFLTRIAVATVATIPLFVVSEDWGRWMHLSAVLVFVTILACKKTTVAFPVRRPALAAACLAALPLFVFSWQVPHWIHSRLPIVRPSTAHLLLQAQEAYVLHAGTH
jgi:hypothetical protein